MLFDKPSEAQAIIAELRDAPEEWSVDKSGYRIVHSTGLEIWVGTIHWRFVKIDFPSIVNFASNADKKAIYALAQPILDKERRRRVVHAFDDAKAAARDRVK